MIPLTQGKFALVDDADHAYLSQFKWRALKHAFKCRIYWTAVRWTYDPNGNRRATYMHQQIIPLVGNTTEIDHKNGNALDNQRENLRSATHIQNLQNRRKAPGTSSRFKGVSWYRRDGNWMAKITINRHQKNLGYFTSEQAAADVYDRAALRYFGEFALTNEQLNRA